MRDPLITAPNRAVTAAIWNPWRTPQHAGRAQAAAGRPGPLARRLGQHGAIVGRLKADGRATGGGTVMAANADDRRRLRQAGAGQAGSGQAWGLTFSSEPLT